MTRYFNTEGSCNPEEHYMVRLDDRLAYIKKMLVDRKKYFVINRGRQYGKTTTLRALENYLKKDCLVLSLDFQQLGTEDFANASAFVRAFTKKVRTAFRKVDAEDKELLQRMLTEFMNDYPEARMDDLFECLSSLCERSSRPAVLMIDEVDSAGNNQVFIEFLAQLRSYYLNRDHMPIFHSVILAGVYSIKNLKLKIRPDSEHQYNSPWNIAADFDVEMDFSAGQIAGMLEEYEADHHTGMDVQAMAEEIYQYTSGYPVLVSLICKRLDEKTVGSDGFGDLSSAWTKKGIEQAVKNILKESPPLLDSMVKQLDIYKNLRSMIEAIMYQGKQIPFSPAEKAVNIGLMLGFLKEKNGHVEISNRIFEMYLLNLFMTEEAVESDEY